MVLFIPLCWQKPWPEALYFQVVHLSMQFLWKRYLCNTLREFLQNGHKTLLGHNDELIRIWLSKQRVTVTPQNMFFAIFKNLYASEASWAKSKGRVNILQRTDWSEIIVTRIITELHRATRVTSLSVLWWRISQILLFSTAFFCLAAFCLFWNKVYLLAMTNSHHFNILLCSSVFICLCLVEDGVTAVSCDVDVTIC